MERGSSCLRWKGKRFSFNMNPGLSKPFIPLVFASSYVPSPPLSIPLNISRETNGETEPEALIAMIFIKRKKGTVVKCDPALKEMFFNYWKYSSQTYQEKQILFREV